MDTGLEGTAQAGIRGILAGTRWIHYHDQKDLSNVGTILRRNLL